MDAHDARLFDRARAGDAEALTFLFRSHHGPVVRYLRGRLGGMADDLAAQTWLDAARNLHTFVGGTDDFRRWLFTIARRRLQDELRRRSRRPVVPLDGVAEPSACDPCFDESDDLERALVIVRRLPSDQADAVLLRIVAGFDVAQVAELMGRSEVSVRVLVHRGLARLRRLLEPESVRSPVTPGLRLAMEQGDG